MSEDNDPLAGLLALGIVVLVGVGLYKILSSFGSFEAGSIVTEEKLIKDGPEKQDSEVNEEERRALCCKAEDEGKDVCWDCLTVEPNRCPGNYRECGNCLECARKNDHLGLCGHGLCCECSDEYERNTDSDD